MRLDPYAIDRPVASDRFSPAVKRPIPLLLAATLLFSADAGRAQDPALRDLFEAGRIEEAREAIARSLDPSSEATERSRADALRWLGRVEVASRNWEAALEAYRELASEFPQSEAARDAATELALLEALAGRADLEAPAGEPAEPGVPTPPPAATTTAAGSEAPAVAPESVGGALVGSFGRPFNSAEEAGEQVRQFLAENGIDTAFEATASQALRGGDAVVAYLIERARALGRPSILMVRSRWGFREFAEVTCYSSDGALLWKDKATGDRGWRDETVKPKLMERLFNKLQKRLGGPGLELEAGDQ